MTKIWSRDDTKEWVIQLEHRLEDIDYYLKKTVDWCEENGIYDDQIVFACASITVLWVSHMRHEPISRREMLEIVGILDWDQVDDFEYRLDDEYSNYDHEEILEAVVNRFY
jgi:hypothetical protein